MLTSEEYNKILKGDPIYRYNSKMTEDAKKFLHQQEGQREWILERLRQCPLSKLQNGNVPS